LWIDEYRKAGGKANVLIDEYENICPICASAIKLADRRKRYLSTCIVCKWKGNNPLMVHKAAGWYETVGFIGPRGRLPN